MGLFDEQISRKPDLYPWTQDFIRAAWGGFWTPDEFDFQGDIQNFKVDLTEQEQEMIVRTLSAIGQIEIAVKKFWARLGDNLPHPSVNDLGLTLSSVEVIHNKAYERLLEVLQLEDRFEENLQLDIIGGRVNYLRKYLSKNYEDDRQNYIYSLILFTLFVENVSLFSQFYTILWFNRYRNVLRDTAQQVMYTKNEENLHAQVGIKLVQILRVEYPELFTAELEERVRNEAAQAFASESNIVDWIVNGYDAENLNSDVLKEYIKNRLNESLVQIGFAPLYNIDEELLLKTEWMEEEVLGNTHVDFFHQRPTEYSKKTQSFNVSAVFGG